MNDAEKLDELAMVCDAYGLPHSALALARHLGKSMDAVAEMNRALVQTEISQAVARIQAEDENEDEAVDEPGEHEASGQYYGRWGRSARNDEIEEFMTIWNITDEDPAYVGAKQYGYRFTLFHDVLVRFRWEEWFKYADGVLEQKDSIAADPLGYCVDAYLEPRHEGDITEVVNFSLRVEYDPNEEPPNDEETD
jgi:hypothetical protein